MKVPFASSLLSTLAVTLLLGCSAAAVATATDFGKDSACALDGMLLQDFPGPKAQIVYEHGERDFFCDTKEMFSQLLQPEQKRQVVAVFTQDMAQADWKQPVGHWIDARNAFYVVGSKREGSMGPAIAAFATEADAQAFARQYGGRALPFASVTLDMADLSGGSAHDRVM